MSRIRPTTINDYIRAAPPAGQAHLRQVYAILKACAPTAEEVIKWGNPFFVEPRFLFAFSAHNAHLSFAPPQAAMDEFQVELAQHNTTPRFLRIPYAEPLPADLVRRLAEYSVRIVAARTSDSFW